MTEKTFRKIEGGLKEALDYATISATNIRVRQIVDLWFRPWGAAKGALWEELSGDRPFDPNVALEMIRDALAGSANEFEQTPP